MQHEVDHLHGICFYNRLTPLKRSLANNKMKKLKKGIYSVDYDMIDPDGSKHEADEE